MTVLFIIEKPRDCGAFFCLFGNGDGGGDVWGDAGGHGGEGLGGIVVHGEGVGELADADEVGALFGGGFGADEVADGIGEVGGNFGDGGCGIGVGRDNGDGAGCPAVHGEVQGVFLVVVGKGFVFPCGGSGGAGGAVGREADAQADGECAGLGVVTEVFEGGIVYIYKDTWPQDRGAIVAVVVFELAEVLVDKFEKGLAILCDGGDACLNGEEEECEWGLHDFLILPPPPSGTPPKNRRRVCQAACD